MHVHPFPSTVLNILRFLCPNPNLFSKSFLETPEMVLVVQQFETIRAVCVSAPGRFMVLSRMAEIDLLGSAVQ